jgi:hypothetical protein
MQSRLTRLLQAATFTGLFAAALLAPAAQAASTTNYTDQWGTVNERGWGISVLQQDDIIFIDLFVYGVDGKPTWFVVGANYNGFTQAGHLVFSGDLYATTGPYYGTVPYDQSLNLGGKVGTLTFDSDTVNTATLSYSVNGVNVTKSIQRQTWGNEDFAGSYSGGMIFDAAGCPTNNGHQQQLGTVAITQAGGPGSAMSVQSSPATGGSCTYSGTYTQMGHMGGLSGTYSCTAGDAGTFTMFEMERSISGMTGRFTSQAGTCAREGRFGGLQM